MIVWAFDSDYFGIHEIWASPEAWRKFYEETGHRVRPYGEGWNMYVDGRLSPVGILRPHVVRD